jgi:large subunit ribosomal protein L16
MGKGKGAISFWVAIIRSGSILFEVSSHKSLRAYLSLVKASTKLPIKTRILSLKI